MHYAELHVKTNLSFLEGASHPEELVRRAAALGYRAMAVTDRCSLAGVVRAYAAARDLDFPLIVGAEVHPDDAAPVVLWATDRAAYGRLCRLITRGRRRAEKGQCRLTLDDIAAHAEGLLAGIPGQAALRCCESAIAAEQPWASEHGYFAAEQKQTPPRRQPITVYRDVFGDRGYLLAELHRGPDDRGCLQRLAALARRSGLPLAAAGDVHYHATQRSALHDVLAAIRHGTTVAALGERRFANACRAPAPVEDIVRRFADAPDAVRRTIEIAQRCTFSLGELRYEYPTELAPDGRTPSEYLAELTWAGARQRYPRGVPDRVRRLVEHELALVAELHYEAYFLTVWDLVRFARGRGILCQGRGSAANSAVCYCLGITAVDPDRADVLFERFVSRERNEAPDIDVDFEHERREEVLQYLYGKYGRDRAGLTAEVITYRPRSAVRDVGKALGLSVDRVDALAKRIEHFHEEPDLAARCREVGIDPASTVGRQLVQRVGELVGFPRHLSQHTGGMVISRGPLCELVPIENAAMPDRTVIQWNKDDLDELGILKIDCLALGMLTAIRKCFELVERHEGRRLSLAGIPPDDPEVYAMIHRADTMGVFQIESRAQMNMLPRLRPRCFYDLVIEVAIVRPGPIQGNMVHPYLRRRNGEEPVAYPNEAIRGVLEKTLGVPLFQEQAMRLAVVAAGFTPGEADQLRRAMGAWRRPGLIEQFHEKLISGMRREGLSEEYAEAVFRQIRGFGDYGFPESHAASFALLVYVSAWLKYHYPAALAAALLNSQPMGFYAPAQLVRNAREHGVEVRPVDVNHSRWDCTLERGHRPPTTSIRLGLRMLRGLARRDAERIVAARAEGPFRSMDDLARRTRLGRAALVRLSQAGAMGSLEMDQRQSLWHALAQDQRVMPLFDSLEAVDHETEPTLPAMTDAEAVLADYRAAGLSLRQHPMALLRESLEAIDVEPAARLKHLADKRSVRTAGVVLVRQRPGTAKGITFVTLEDETGTVNLIIRPAVWKRFRQAALGATILLAEGRLERHESAIHVLVHRLENLSGRLEALGARSRDFC